jgi:hypothetical protein
MTIPQGANLRWSIDFVLDTMVSGRRFRILTMWRRWQLKAVSPTLLCTADMNRARKNI